MRYGTEYVVVRPMTVSASNDDSAIRLDKGETIIAIGMQQAMIKRTGFLIELGRLHAMNPSWYLASGFNFKVPEVTLAELAYETVRWNEGLQVDLLYSIAIDACPRKVPTYSSFTAALSKDDRIVMCDELGQLVAGVGHNKRFCTYHLRSTTASARVLESSPSNVTSRDMLGDKARCTAKCHTSALSATSLACSDVRGRRALSVNNSERECAQRGVKCAQR